MIFVKPTQAGISTNRLEQNQLEKRFVETWRQVNSNHFNEVDYRHLSYILSDNPQVRASHERPELPSDRDIQVAETVVQWLGSPVGQAFLREVLKIEIREEV